MPNVAPALARDHAREIVGGAAGRADNHQFGGGRMPRRKVRAASSRAAADVEVTMRTFDELLPDAMPDTRDRSALPRGKRL